MEHLFKSLLPHFQITPDFLYCLEILREFFLGQPHLLPVSDPVSRVCRRLSASQTAGGNRLFPPTALGQVERKLIAQGLLPSNGVPFANCHHFLRIVLQALFLTFSSEKLPSLCAVTSFGGYSLTLGILLCNYNCRCPRLGKPLNSLRY